MSNYPYAERDKAYAVIERTTEMVDLLEAVGKGKLAYDESLQEAITHMTGSSDLHQQFQAMKHLRDSVEKQHRDRIIAAAPHDFSAYVEAISPGEACRSRVHRFLSEQLMTMSEVDDSKMALSMPPGHAKDLCVRTPVLMGDGSSKRLGDINVGDMVITHTGLPQEVLEVHDQGLRETIVLHTQNGRAIRTHPDHPFLTPSGWIPAKDLARGDVLAQQREFSIPNTSGRTREEFILAGYMMSYGMVRGRAYSRLTEINNTFRTDDPLILEDVITLAKNIGYRAKSKIAITYDEEVRTLHFEETFRYWLETQGLWGLHRHTMRIPSWVFQGSAEEIGAYLGAIFSMDAKLRPSRSKHTGAQRMFSIKVRNPGLMKDLRRLLMRIGVRSELHAALERCYNYEPTTFWTLTIRYDEDIYLLRRSLRIIGINRRFWDVPIPVRRFFDARYGEDMITKVNEAEPTETRCLTVENDHSFLADGIVVHNSTYCSRLFPAWWISRNEGKKWLQAGHTQKFAEKEFGKKLRDNILKSEGHLKVFPDAAVSTEAMDEIVLMNRSSYVVKGVGQGISGYRSNFNNIDDPYPTEKSAQSEVTRNAVWEWFTNDFRTRRLPGASELIIVTRWHSDDIVGRLEDMMANGEMEKDWQIINLPAFSLGEDVDQLRRKKGEVLWPEFFTPRFLLDMKAPMNESRWESLYQGNPTLSDGLVLKRAWLKYYDRMPSTKKVGSGDPQDSQPAGKIPSFIISDRGPSESLTGPSESESNSLVQAVRIVISVDSAEKETVRADYSSIQAWLYGTDKKHYLLDVVKDKMEFPKLCLQIEAMARKWNADLILCETKGAGNQYVQLRSGEAPCPVLGYNPGRDDKTIRFEGTMTYWQAGDVILPERAPWLTQYVDELLRFPNGKHDDAVDATSQYLNWHRAGAGARRGSKKLQGTG